ncbi:MAG: hypothetical protein J6X67_11030 [Treponema sp.]|nr:hypothetical protein [Treponema sp.]
MIFITNNDIVEVSTWALKGNEIFSNDSLFHEILNPIFSIISGSKKFEFLKDAIVKQIKKHSGYIDLRPYLTQDDGGIK